MTQTYLTTLVLSKRVKPGTGAFNWRPKEPNYLKGIHNVLYDLEVVQKYIRKFSMLVIGIKVTRGGLIFPQFCRHLGTIRPLFY
jgi:hypothetical protein